VVDYREQAVRSGADAPAFAYVEVEVNGRVTFGVGRHVNIITASLSAIANGYNRIARAPALASV
jgi:2-isopropylmalate synthase